MMKNPIKPHRALYICNQENPECKNPMCKFPIGDETCTMTTNVLYAKNGPVVNVKEWETRFDVQDLNGVLYYVEKKETQSK